MQLIAFILEMSLLFAVLVGRYFSFLLILASLLCHIGPVFRFVILYLKPLFLLDNHIHRFLRCDCFNVD